MKEILGSGGEDSSVPSPKSPSAPLLSSLQQQHRHQLLQTTYFLSPLSASCNVLSISTCCAEAPWYAIAWKRSWVARTSPSAASQSCNITSSLGGVRSLLCFIFISCYVGMLGAADLKSQCGCWEIGEVMNGVGDRNVRESYGGSGNPEPTFFMGIWCWMMKRVEVYL